MAATSTFVMGPGPPYIFAERGFLTRGARKLCSSDVYGITNWPRISPPGKAAVCTLA